MVEFINFHFSLPPLVEMRGFFFLPPGSFRYHLRCILHRKFSTATPGSGDTVSLPTISPPSRIPRISQLRQFWIYFRIRGSHGQEGRKEGKKRSARDELERERERERKFDHPRRSNLFDDWFERPIDPSGQIYYRREGIRPLFHQDSNATRSFRLMERI